jgi:hypothetical protein
MIGAGLQKRFLTEEY